MDRTERGRCALEGTRTPNLLIRSQMLYPLSYERIAVWLTPTVRACAQKRQNEKAFPAGGFDHTPTNGAHQERTQARHSTPKTRRPRTHISAAKPTFLPLPPDTSTSRTLSPRPWPQVGRQTCTSRTIQTLSWGFLKEPRHTVRLVDRNIRREPHIRVAIPQRDSWHDSSREGRREYKGSSTHPAAHPYPCCLPALGRFG